MDSTRTVIFVECVMKLLGEKEVEFECIDVVVSSGGSDDMLDVFANVVVLTSSICRVVIGAKVFSICIEMFWLGFGNIAELLAFLKIAWIGRRIEDFNCDTIVS